MKPFFFLKILFRPQKFNMAMAIPPSCRCISYWKMGEIPAIAMLPVAGGLDPRNLTWIPKKAKSKRRYIFQCIMIFGHPGVSKTVLRGIFLSESWSFHVFFWCGWDVLRLILMLLKWLDALLFIYFHWDGMQVFVISCELEHSFSISSGSL